MAGDIDEAKAVAKDLKEDGSQAAVRLHDRIMAAIPRFEASEDVGCCVNYRTQIITDYSLEAKAS